MPLIGRISAYFGAVLSLGFFSQAFADVVIVPRQGSEFLAGSGYDSVTSEVKSECIEYDSIETLSDTQGGASDQEYTEIRTREELRSTLGISAAGSFGYGAFSGSAKASFHQENRFDRQTYYLSARSSVVRQTEVLRGVRLTPEAKELLATNPEAFHRACGDSYVGARTVGGEFTALIRLDTSTEEEMRELRTSFKASYAAMDGSASVTSKVTELFEQHNGTVRFIRIGGVGEFPNSEPADVREYLRQFPTQIIGEGSEPFALSVTTRKYSSLLDAAALEPVNVVSSVQVMEELARYYDRALDMRDNLAYVVSNPNEFPDFDEENVDVYDDLITNVLNIIRSQARQCRDFPTDTDKCKFLNANEIDLNEVALPERKEIVYIEMASSNCPLLGHEQEERPRICRTAANGEEIAERSRVSFWYSPSYDEGLSRNKVAGNIQTIKPLYDGLCLPNARKLDIFQAFSKDATVWTVASSEIVEVMNVRGGSAGGILTAPPQDLVARVSNWIPSSGTPAMDMYPSNRFVNSIFQPNPWGLWLNCQTEIVRTQFVEAAHEDCGMDVITNFDKKVYAECRHPAHGIELSE